MLRVRDIMTRNVISLPGDAPLETAAWRLAAEAVSGAPVRDARGNLIGVLSKSDLVTTMREKPQARVVQDAMTPGVWAVHPDDAAMEAVKLMVEKDIHRVLVVRGPGQLEGIITTMDIMRALVNNGPFHPEGSRAPIRTSVIAPDDSEGDEDEAGAIGAPAGQVTS